MLRTSSCLTVGLLCSLSTVVSGSELYLLLADTQKDQLVRVDLDGTETPIGNPGDLNFPSVSALFWDSVNEQLYGYDDLVHAFLSIDFGTGVGTFLSFADVDYFFYDTGFDPGSGAFYAAPDQPPFILGVDLQTGATWEAIPILNGNIAQGAEYVSGAFGPADALYYWANELRAVIGPDWDSDILIAPLSGPMQLAYDVSSNAMYGMKSFDVYSVNRTNGDAELLFSISFNTRSNIVAIGEGVVPPECDQFDSDGDGDVDLTDFAEFNACFTEDVECLRADTNGDGTVDPLDVGYVLARLGCE